MGWTYPRTIFDGVNDTGIKKFDNLFLYDFFHIGVKSTLPLNDGFGIILKVDFVFAEGRADARNIRCFLSKCFFVIFENSETRRFFSSDLSRADMITRRMESFSRKIIFEMFGQRNSLESFNNASNFSFITSSITSMRKHVPLLE
ncbi:hypothetical protein Tco_0660659 [Tanacetum coccineum]